MRVDFLVVVSYQKRMKVCCVCGWSLKAWLESKDCSNEQTYECWERNKQTNNLFVVRISRCERARWLSYVYLCISSHHRLKWDRFLCFCILTRRLNRKIWNLKMETEVEKGERKTERKKEVKRSWYKNLRRLKLKCKRNSAMFSDTNKIVACVSSGCDDEKLWWFLFGQTQFNLQKERNIFMERFSFSGSI